MEETLGKTESALVAARREHLAALRSRSGDPFAQTRYDVDATAAELAERYGFLVAGQDASAEGWNLAGRLLSKRRMGKTTIVYAKIPKTIEGTPLSTSAMNRTTPGSR